MASCQTLGTILENRGIQKLIIFNNKICAPTLVYFNIKKMRKIPMTLDGAQHQKENYTDELDMNIPLS